jgi:hypothetical protein
MIISNKYYHIDHFLKKDRDFYLFKLVSLLEYRCRNLAVHESGRSNQTGMQS